jgi:hypothetical protein
VRSSLDHKALGPWKEHTRYTNLTGKLSIVARLVTASTRDVQQSPLPFLACSGRVMNSLRRLECELVTNAWAKMFELLAHFELFSQTSGPK